MKPVTAALLITIGLAAGPACAPSPGQLATETARRLESEGVVRRLENGVFRYTEGGGRRGGTWDEGEASIVVTRRTVLLHQGKRVMLEISGAGAGAYEVRRDAGRVAIRTGTGRSSRSWSFEPPDDAEGWTRDIRSVLRAAAGGE